jgi:uncharacterized OsmC-like protein
MNDRSGPGFSEEQREIIRDGVRKRESAHDPVGMRGLNQIEVVVLEGLEYTARNLAEDVTMNVGEPADRGGTGHGASPLSHFLTGAGACLLNQFIRVSVTEDYPLAFAKASVRGEFRRESGGGMVRMACEIRAEGEIGDREAQDLVERAERLCYIHVTLTRAIEMTTVLVVNDRERVRRVSGVAWAPPVT